jgi:hypothetical protein
MPKQTRCTTCRKGGILLVIHAKNAHEYASNSKRLLLCESCGKRNSSPAGVPRDPALYPYVTICTPEGNPINEPVTLNDGSIWLPPKASQWWTMKG